MNCYQGSLRTIAIWECIQKGPGLCLLISSFKKKGSYARSKTRNSGILEYFFFYSTLGDCFLIPAKS